MFFCTLFSVVASFDRCWEAWWLPVYAVATCLLRCWLTNVGRSQQVQLNFSVILYLNASFFKLNLHFCATIYCHYHPNHHLISYQCYYWTFDHLHWLDETNSHQKWLNCAVPPGIVSVMEYDIAFRQNSALVFILQSQEFHGIFKMHLAVIYQHPFSTCLLWIAAPASHCCWQELIRRRKSWCHLTRSDSFLFPRASVNPSSLWCSFA